MAPEDSARGPTHRPLRRFLLSAIPGWVIGAIAAVAAYQLMALPAWAAVALMFVWILADIATFPRRRRYFTDEPAQRRIVGEVAIAVSDLTPSGFVRVHGELWQAHTEAAEVIRKDALVRVSNIDGLELTVERM
jgi:membrane-bound serine protease (ClpP class)